MSWMGNSSDASTIVGYANTSATETDELEATMWTGAGYTTVTLLGALPEAVADHLESLLEALPEILASGMILGNEPNLRHIETMPPLPTKTGRRLIDKIMDDGILTRLPDLTDDEVVESLDNLREVETELSNQRRELHSVIDAIQDEIVARYRKQQDQTQATG